MSLNQEIILLQQKYQQLPRVPSIPQKRLLIEEIRVIGKRLQVLATADQDRVKLRQLKGVLAVVDQVQARLNCPSSIIFSDEHRASVQMAVDMLVHRSIEVQALEESPQKKAQIRRRIVAAVEVMRDVDEMVREEGGDLLRIEQNIDVAMGNAEIAGQEVGDIVQRTRRGRLRRLRASIMEVLAGLGYYILGLPGMAIGVISAWLF